MTTANKLTSVRMILVPVFLAFLIIAPIQNFWAAIAVFILASLTDLLDGHIARKYNQISDFGKFLDPIADKILTIAAFVGMVEIGLASSWVAIIIITREFMVTGLRLIAASDGNVIAAGIWGKAKTVSQMAAIIIVLFFHVMGWSAVPGMVMLGICTLLTIYSGYDYLKANWAYISKSK